MSSRALNPSNAVGERVRPAQRFFKRLGDFGYARRYVQTVVMPPWWDESELEDPAGLLEAKLRVKSFLGIPPELLDTDGADLPRTTAQFRGGHPDAPELQTVKLMAMQIAELVAHAFGNSPYHPLPGADAVREHLLTTWGEPWVSFECLARASWVHGIPLVHVGNIPDGKGVCKPAAMCVRSSTGRPVVLLFRKHQAPAWLLWDLAHEIGHIASGHLDETTIVWDERLAPGQSSDTEDDGHAGREAEANRYGMTMLTGSSDFQKPIPQHSGVQIANSAQLHARNMKVDPGLLVLMNAYRGASNAFAKAQVALKAIGGQSPQRTCNDLLFSRLTEEMLPAEQIRFLQAVTAS